MIGLVVELVEWTIKATLLVFLLSVFCVVALGWLALACVALATKNPVPRFPRGFERTLRHIL
jgi:Tfp pilus assembly protein PilO